MLGLGLAFAIAYLIGAVFAMQVLGYKLTGFPVRAVLVALARMGIAALLMAEAAWLVGHVGANTGWEALARIVVGSVAGLVVYVGALVVLRAPEIDQLKSWFTRRGDGGGAASAA